MLINPKQRNNIGADNDGQAQQLLLVNEGKKNNQRTIIAANSSSASCIINNYQSAIISTLVSVGSAAAALDADRFRMSYGECARLFISSHFFVQRINEVRKNDF